MVVVTDGVKDAAPKDVVASVVSSFGKSAAPAAGIGADVAAVGGESGAVVENAAAFGSGAADVSDVVGCDASTFAAAISDLAISQLFGSSDLTGLGTNSGAPEIGFPGTLLLLNVTGSIPCSSTLVTVSFESNVSASSLEQSLAFSKELFLRERMRGTITRGGLEQMPGLSGSGSGSGFSTLSS